MTEGRVRFVLSEVTDNGDALGTGGLRRPNGTVSALVRNPRYIDDDVADRLLAPPAPVAPSFRHELAQQIGSQVVDYMLREVIVPNATRLLKERVVPAINRKRQERRARRPIEVVGNEIVEGEIAEEDQASVPSVDLARDETILQLGRDEAEWHIREARRAARELGDHLAVLRAARVVDDADIPALLEGRGRLEVSRESVLEESEAAQIGLRRDGPEQDKIASPAS